MVARGALCDQAASGISDQLGAQRAGCLVLGGLGAVAPLRNLGRGALGGAAIGHSFIAHAGPMGDGQRPAIGVVLHRHALAAHTGFLDQAVGRVVGEVKALAVLVEEKVPLAAMKWVFKERKKQAMLLNYWVTLR